MPPSKSAQRSLRAAALTPTAAAPQDDHALWQQAHDQVQAAFDKANAALAGNHDKQQRRALFDVADALSDELTALNRRDMEDRTIAIQAATAQLTPGITRLQTLQQQLKDIAQALATAAEVIGAVDSAISGMKAFLAIL